MSDPGSTRTDRSTPRPKGLDGRLLHPFLFAAFPIFYLARVNLWSITFAEVLPPLLVAVGVVLVIYRISRRVWSDTRRPGFALSVCILLFFSYGHVWTLVDKKELQGALIAGDAVLGPLWGALAILGVVVAVRTKAIGVATRVMNAIAIALVLIIATPVVVQLSTVRSAAALPVNGGTERTGEARSVDASERPDIYYIVFDRYAGPRTLRDQIGYENDGFLGFLERNGFAVSCSSFANYENTSKSLAASLNLRYVDWISDRAGHDSRSLTPFFSAIRNNAVVRFLKAREYRYIHIGSWFDATNTNPQADVNFRLDAPSGFTRALYTSSALWPAARRGLINIGKGGLHRSSALRQLELLRKVPSLPGPKFVFAHILLPHPPYVFNADGSRMTHERRVEFVRSGRSAYVEQTKYLNARLRTIIWGLLAEDRKRPQVVIMQADEGPHLPDVRMPSWKEPSDASDEQLLVKYHIMSAIHLPGADKGLVSDEITPVNVFRLVFDEYFGTSFGTLPNRAYVSPWDRPHQLTNITKRLRESMDDPYSGEDARVRCRSGSSR